MKTMIKFLSYEHDPVLHPLLVLHSFFFFSLTSPATAAATATAVATATATATPTQKTYDRFT